MDRLWCDKYRPRTLELLDYHKNISTMLRKLSFCVDFPHLLFYGPNGAGKKTRVMAFLSETFGNGVFKLKQDYWEFKLSASNSTKVECTVLMSNYHIDITPSECESYDHVVLQKLIKEVVNNFQIDSNKTQKGVKFIVINDCDKLSRAAQAALSRTMEKYSEICKLILVCENLGKIIHPLRGKCAMIRVPAPSYTDIENVLKMILKKENTFFPEQLFGKIAEMSERNMRKAILQFQTMRLKLANTTNGTLDFYAPEWRQGIRNIFEQIIKEQSLKT